MLVLLSNLISFPRSSPGGASTFDWATRSGAYIAEALSIAPETVGAPRGLKVTTDVPEGAVLLTLPAALQLGVDGCDSALLDTLPPSAWSARLGLALCAEKRREDSSSFAEYIAELPLVLTSCLAPGYATDASDGLKPWPPTAVKAEGMRRSLRSLHSKLERTAAELQVEAPTLQQLGWATAIAGSRAYRVRGAPGKAAAADAARLLPIVDLANYGTAAQANAELRNAPSSGGAEATDDPLAVSLYASKEITAGTEVLIDYGCGASLSGERLLLEYGFTLPGDETSDSVNLPFGAIAIGLGAVESTADGASQPSAEDAVALGTRQQLLLAELGDIETAGLTFEADGSPSESTHALALLLTAQAPTELARPTTAELVTHATDAGASSPHALRARCALCAVATEASQQVRAALADSAVAADAGFEAEARRYCETRAEILERASQRMGRESSTIDST